MIMSSSAMSLSTAQGLSGDREGGTATVPAVTTHTVNSNMGLGIWRQEEGEKKTMECFPGASCTSRHRKGGGVPGAESSMTGLGHR